MAVQLIDKAGEDWQRDGQLLAALLDTKESLESTKRSLDTRIGKCNGIESEVNMPGAESGEAILDGVVGAALAAEGCDPLHECGVGGRQADDARSKVAETEGLVGCAGGVVLAAGLEVEAVPEEVCNVAGTTELSGELNWDLVERLEGAAWEKR